MPEVILSNLLFVYGTLRPDHAPSEIADAVRWLIQIGPGTIRARLYDLGAYPGVVLDESGSGRVDGEVFALPDAATLARLDAYEDYRPHDPEGSLFLRVKTTVTMQTGAREDCWVYVYNGELPGAGPASPTI
jgi:gamma-glutamylcyclotransferase (GGCT)/AIG2-like uncharacterized protein YtfP